jgi:prepilin-type N-terminal cleavage/methylation domain-containing protein
MIPAAAREDGFSLVEVLVSLAVIAVMSGLLFDTLSRNLRLAQEMTRRREAVLLAQSLLAEASVPSPGTGLQDAGRRGPLAWRIDRRTQQDNARETGPRLQELRIRVTDAATGRPLTSVTTLRLAR